MKRRLIRNGSIVRNTRPFSAPSSSLSVKKASGSLRCGAIPRIAGLATGAMPFGLREGGNIRIVSARGFLGRLLGNAAAMAVAALLAGATLPVSYGAESIEVSGVTTEVEVVEGVELTVVVELVDGDITVIREERTTVSFTIEEYDESDEDHSSASIDRDEVAGTIRLRLRGELRDSDIVVHAPLRASLRLKALDGSIVVTGGWGDVDVSASDGDIELREIGGAIVASSNDGDLEATLAAGRKSAPISLATQDGDIRLFVPGEMDADVSVSTIDGEFECDVPLTLSRGGGEGRPVFRKRGAGVHIEGILGKGGHRVTLKTIDGDVELKRRSAD